MGGRLADGGRAVVLGLALVASGCNTLNDAADTFIGGGIAEGTPGHVAGFLGGAVADEPRAALAAREVLSAGGNAADAAVALGFTLAVTLPSRAGLGGGGACLVLAPGRDTPNAGIPEAIMFVPPAGAAGGPGALRDRPAAVPMLPRGLFALHARYGKRPFETLISPAEQMARFGVPASRAFARDLGVVAGPLAADRGAAAVFFRNGQPLQEGATLAQPDLGATLAQLRTAGVGDLYQGVLARRIEAGSVQSGGGLTIADLRAALPRLAPVLSIEGAGGDTLSFLPPPADGGLAAAAAMQALRAEPSAVDAANARALGVATRFRQGGADAAALLASRDTPPANLPALPASSTFMTLDKDGMAVVCAVTMNNLFGTGRIAAGTGMVMAASPTWLPPPLLAAGIAWNKNIRAFHAMAGGSGQSGAPLAVAVGLTQALADRAPVPQPMPVPDPGRANVIGCSRYLPDESRSCGWATDPRGAGLAVGSN